MKKRFLPLLMAAALFICVPLSCTATAQAKTRTINVYNWGLYISDGSDGLLDVNTAFTEATGIEVNYSTYDSNESMYTKLKTGGSSYDIIIPSDYMIARLIGEGMLEKLDFNNIPNYSGIGDSFKNTAYDPDNAYSVPYLWGTVGIIYNTKFVDSVTSWDALWNSEYSDKILMFDNPRDTFAIAELRLGYDVNTENEAELQAAAELLAEQKPLVQSYVMDQVFEQMERAEAWITPYYAGDFITMHRENPDLAFCFPEEGFNLYTDAMCIPTSCSDKEAAEAYINFMCSFEAASANATFTGYGSPVEGVAETLDLTDQERAIAYPSAEVLSNGVAFLNMSAEANKKMDSLWLEVRTSATNWIPYVVITGAVVLAAAILMAVRSNKKKKRAAKRRANSN